MAKDTDSQWVHTSWWTLFHNDIIMYNETNHISSLMYCRNVPPGPVMRGSRTAWRQQQLENWGVKVHVKPSPVPSQAARCSAASGDKSREGRSHVGAESTQVRRPHGGGVHTPVPNFQAVKRGWPCCSPVCSSFTLDCFGLFWLTLVGFCSFPEARLHPWSSVDLL